MDVPYFDSLKDIHREPQFPWTGKNSYLPGEPSFNYRPGGYHPVHIGDVFNNGQYKVIRKLTWDGCSTGWLARDQK